MYIYICTHTHAHFSVQKDRKGYRQQTRTLIFTMATSLFIMWSIFIKAQQQEGKCKCSGTFKY